MDRLRGYINRVIFIVSSLLLTVMVATVAWQVTSRYVFNSPSIFTDELARFLLMWIGMLGTTYAFGCKAHLSMDYLHTFLRAETVKIMKVTLPILSIVFMGFVMVWGGTLLTLNTMKQLSPVLYIPMGVVYSILPITGVINIFYFMTYITDELALKESDR